jgi:ABC-type nitrate/sulfonate/bicarbonate transport system permease component
MSSSTLTEPLTRSSDSEADAGRRRQPRRSRRWLGVLFPLALAGLWAGLSGSGAVSASLLPPPWTVLASAREFFFGEQLLTLAGVVPFAGAGPEHIAASLVRCLVSYAAAVAVGLSVGLVLGLSRLASDLLDPAINGLRAVPLYAWLPISLVWFGLGEGATRALIFIGALWPVLIATADSVSRVPRGHVEAARMLGVPRHRMWRRVYVPSALPEIVTGLRLSLTLAWMSVIVGELTGTATGVGAMMNSARESGRIDQIIVGMFVFAVVGYTADVVLRLVTRRWVRWSLT